MEHCLIINSEIYSYNPLDMFIFLITFNYLGDNSTGLFIVLTNPIIINVNHFYSQSKLFTINKNTHCKDLVVGDCQREVSF